MPGSVHDMRVFAYSGVQQLCTNDFFPPGTHLLGDGAYTLQENVMVPYKDNGHLTLEQKHFNVTHSQIRSTIERVNGILKGRWRYFNVKLPMRRTDLIPFYITAVCVLHNICQKRNDDFEYPLIEPDAPEDYPEPIYVEHIQKINGVLKREEIMHTLCQ